jgi:two-component system, NtrC family, sensor kinase
MHRLLARQLKKQFGSLNDVPEGLIDFIERIDEAYVKADADFALLSHSLDEMSRELNERNDALRRERDEQAAMARRLEEAHNQLLQSEKMASVGQLAAGVAHEINNPVGYINSNLNTLGECVGDLFELLECYERSEAEMSPARQASLARLRERIDLSYLKNELPALLGESREGINRVKKIVNDLKDFSHSDTGVFTWANVHQGLDSTLNIATNEIKYKADVVREYGDIPDIECLPSQLNQVFMNLVVNAAQAMDEAKRGRITVRTGMLDGNTVTIEVSDNGSGITEKNLVRIFDPFFTTKPIGKGTGLGLSLSYGIIQKHHGSIHVESVVGEGTTFRICLPVCQPLQP